MGAGASALNRGGLLLGEVPRGLNVTLTVDGPGAFHPELAEWVNEVEPAGLTVFYEHTNPLVTLFLRDLGMGSKVRFLAREAAELAEVADDLIELAGVTRLGAECSYPQWTWRWDKGVTDLLPDGVAINRARDAFKLFERLSEEYDYLNLEGHGVLNLYTAEVLGETVKELTELGVSFWLNWLPQTAPGGLAYITMGQRETLFQGLGNLLDPWLGQSLGALAEVAFYDMGGDNFRWQCTKPELAINHEGKTSVCGNRSGGHLGAGTLESFSLLRWLADRGKCLGCNWAKRREEEREEPSLYTRMQKEKGNDYEGDLYSYTVSSD